MFTLKQVYPFFGMKKNSSMVALLLAFIGFVLITGSLFSLYKSSVSVVEVPEKKDLEIDIANKKIDVLTDEIKETKEQFVQSYPFKPKKSKYVQRNA